MKKHAEEILSRFEAEHPAGVTALEIIAALASAGVKVSEPTLRKYVQVGLLPRSRRVGAKGRHQGSWGLYPWWAARQIMEVKRLLAEGRTMLEIAEGSATIHSQCMELAEALRRIEARAAQLSASKGMEAGRMADIRDRVGRAADLVEEAARPTARDAYDMEGIAI